MMRLVRKGRVMKPNPYFPFFVLAFLALLGFYVGAGNGRSFDRAYVLCGQHAGHSSQVVIRQFRLLAERQVTCNSARWRETFDAVCEGYDFVPTVGGETYKHFALAAVAMYPELADRVL